MSVYIDTNVRSKKELQSLILQKTSRKPYLNWRSIEYFCADGLFVELGLLEAKQGNFFFYKWKETLIKDIDSISEKADVDDIAYHMWNTTCVFENRKGKLKETKFHKYVRRHSPLWYQFFTSNLMVFLALYVPMAIYFIVPSKKFSELLCVATGLISYFIYSFLSVHKKWFAPIVTLIFNTLVASLYLILSPKSDYYVNSEFLVYIAEMNLIPLLFIPIIVFMDEKYRGKIHQTGT